MPHPSRFFLSAFLLTLSTAPLLGCDKKLSGTYAYGKVEAMEFVGDHVIISSPQISSSELTSFKYKVEDHRVFIASPMGETVGELKDDAIMIGQKVYEKQTPEKVAATKREEDAARETVRKEAILDQERAKVTLELNKKAMEKKAEKDRLEQAEKKDYDEACYAAETNARKGIADLEEKFEADTRKVAFDYNADARKNGNQKQDLNQAWNDKVVEIQKRLGFGSAAQTEMRMGREQFDAAMADKNKEGDDLLAAFRKQNSTLRDDKDAAIHAAQVANQDQLTALKTAYTAKIKAIEDQVDAK